MAHLTEVLKEENLIEKQGELPSKERARVSAQALAAECPAPQFKRKTFKQLGTPTVQATKLSDDRVHVSREELLSAAQNRRRELEDAGEIDWVSDRQPYPTGQGPTPDHQMVGKRVEIRWRYRHVETGEPVYIWCEGEVTKVQRPIYSHLDRPISSSFCSASLLMLRSQTARMTSKQLAAREYSPLGHSKSSGPQTSIMMKKRHWSGLFSNQARLIKMCTLAGDLLPLNCSRCRVLLVRLLAILDAKSDVVSDTRKKMETSHLHYSSSSMH